MTARIAIYVAAAHTARGSLSAVSGHVQIPLATARLLRDHGHHVTLITTVPRPGQVMPPMLPADVRVVTLLDASRVWPARRPNYFRGARHLLELGKHLREQRYDVVHFFGFRNAAVLAGLSASLPGSSPTVLSLAADIGGRAGTQAVLRQLLKRVGVVAAFTGTTAENLSAMLGRPVEVTRPAPSKTINVVREGVVPDTVLFWRNASRSNGADTAAAAFRSLSRRYPHIRFCFAVRPNDELESDLQAVGQTYENISVQLYPYEGVESLEALIGRAICCVFPFRTLSINPQFAILETMQAGCPVVVSEVESNAELVEHGQAGLLLAAGDAGALETAVGHLIEDEALRTQLATQAQKALLERWNWRSYWQGLQAAYQQAACLALEEY